MLNKSSFLLFTTVLTSFLLFTFSLQPAHAANCDGLPVTGGDLVSGTYTLTDNCVTTATLNIQIGENVTINGGGFAIDGNNTHRVIYIASGGTLILNNVTIRNGNSVDSGGGVANSGGTLTIINSIISNNSTTLNGGGIDNSIGALTITNSTIVGNSADFRGGGIMSADGPATLSNSTLSNNSAGISGGGIYNINTGFAVINSTLSGNSAGVGGGGIFNIIATLTFTNSILTNNNTNCGGDHAHDYGGNLIDTANGGACNGITPHVDADPMLGAFNGRYYPLLTGSPAIDSAPDCVGLTNDQIGTARPQGSACDIGAIEAIVDPVTGEVIQPSTPALNQWNGEYLEEVRAEAYGVDDSVYATIHMQNGAWQYNAGGVPQTLIDYGVIMAIDVWEQDGDQYFDTYERVCLLGEGRLIYFDATQSPRRQVEITPVDFEDGYTCGWIPNAGTLVLIAPE